MEMIRVLKFDTPNERAHFSRIWEGLIHGAVAAGQARTRDEKNIRLEARVFRKLKAVSREHPDPKKLLQTGDRQRELLVGAQEVELGQPELTLLSGYCEGNPFWSPIDSPEVVDMWDFLAGAGKMEK